MASTSPGTIKMQELLQSRGASLIPKCLLYLAWSSNCQYLLLTPNFYQTPSPHFSVCSRSLSLGNVLPSFSYKRLNCNFIVWLLGIARQQLTNLSTVHASIWHPPHTCSTFPHLILLQHLLGHFLGGLIVLYFSSQRLKSKISAQLLV